MNTLELGVSCVARSGSYICVRFLRDAEMTRSGLPLWGAAQRQMSGCDETLGAARR